MSEDGESDDGQDLQQQAIGPESSGPSRREVLAGTAVAATAVAATISLGSSISLGSAQAAPPSTVPMALVRRLRDHGVNDLFGVPGATCSALFEAARTGGMRIVVTSSDLEAAYAAEGYARVRGLSVVSVSYGVGALALLPVVAGAYAEHVPMLIVNGGPSAQDLRLQEEHGALYSHSAARPNADLAAFQQVAAAAIRVDKLADARAEIDRAIRTALTERRPVYLEIAKHLWWGACTPGTGSLHAQPDTTPGDPAAVATITGVLQAARRPLVMVGVDVQRQGLSSEVEAWLKQTGLPWVSTLLGKSAIDERTPGLLGVYMGGRSLPAVRQAVDQSDAVLALGTVMSRTYRDLATKAGDRLIRIEGGQLWRNGKRSPAGLGGVVHGLAKMTFTAPKWAPILTDRSFDGRRTSLVKATPGPVTQVEDGLHYEDVVRAVSDLMTEDFVAVTDTSLSMYPCAELNTHGRGRFVCNGVWQSIGFSVGAGLGVGLAQDRRPVVLCGDGGFQMTSMALSTMARHRVRAIVVLFDNALYGIEQFLLNKAWFGESRPTDPLPYLALHRWKYDQIGVGMGVSLARTVSDKAGLDAALKDAIAADGPALITARIKPHDLPPELRS